VIPKATALPREILPVTYMPTAISTVTQIVNTSSRVRRARSSGFAVCGSMNRAGPIEMALKPVSDAGSITNP